MDRYRFSMLGAENRGVMRDQGRIVVPHTEFNIDNRMIILRVSSRGWKTASATVDRRLSSAIIRILLSSATYRVQAVNSQQLMGAYIDVYWCKHHCPQAAWNGDAEHVVPRPNRLGAT